VNNANEDEDEAEHESEAWYRRGKLHRDGDKPAVVMGDGTMLWFQNGNRHRSGDKPAEVCSYGSLEWYENDKHHRNGDEPAEIRLTTNGQILGLHWYKNGELSRDSDKPALIDMLQILSNNFIIPYRVGWGVNGIQHRDNNLPARIFIGPKKIELFWYINGRFGRTDDGPSVITVDNGTYRLSWFKNGVRHRDGNALADILYNNGDMEGKIIHNRAVVDFNFPRQTLVNMIVKEVNRAKSVINKYSRDLKRIIHMATPDNLKHLLPEIDGTLSNLQQ
jgi:hypothetical protein